LVNEITIFNIKKIKNKNISKAERYYIEKLNSLKTKKILWKKRISFGYMVYG
jgi:hypothetical protein